MYIYIYNLIVKILSSQDLSGAGAGSTVDILDTVPMSLGEEEAARTTHAAKSPPPAPSPGLTSSERCAEYVAASGKAAKGEATTKTAVCPAAAEAAPEVAAVEPSAQEPNGPAKTEERVFTCSVGGCKYTKTKHENTT